MSSVQRTLALFKQVHVYKLPPRPSATGWMCQQWGGNDAHLWSGRLRVAAHDTTCTIHLEQPDGTLFAQATLDNDKPDVSVEPVADSSRYFVLRVSDGQRHAFLGIGFAERGEAFDFSCTLADHVKTIRREAESERLAAESEASPPPDRSLKANVTIAIPGRVAEGERPTPAAGGSAPVAMLLAPPPPSGGGGRRRLAPAVAPASSADAFGAPPSDGGAWATFE